MLWYSVFVLVQCSVLVLCYTKPETPCELTDLNCVTKIGKDIFQAVMSEDNKKLGLESLDPMHHKLIEANLPVIKFSLKNCIVKGFKKAVFKEMQKLSPQSLRFEIIVPQLELMGDYKIKGQVLNSSIEGEGKVYVNATNANTVVDAAKKVYEKNGKHYLELYNIETKSELLGTMYLNLENLFNGNKEQADPVLKFINENSKLVANYWQDPIVNANLKKIIKNMNKILENVAIEDMVKIKF